ncbi:MAG: alpha/beta fold hydrolase [Gemmatimonadales bacterium]
MPVPRGAVVFVHGFRGNAIETWFDFPFRLPKEQKAADYDLLFYGYDSREQAPYSARSLNLFLRAVAEDPARQIVNPSLAAGLQKRPDTFRYDHIVIAAHSLGAVVSRLALLGAVSPQRDPLPWLSKVRLVLFAPAHAGAPAVKLASLVFMGLPVGSALEALARKRYKSIDDLDPAGQTIPQLRTDIQQFLASAPANVADCHRAWVTHGSADWVVKAGQYLQDNQFLPMNGAGHFEVCKPTQKDHRPLDFLLGVLP